MLVVLRVALSLFIVAVVAFLAFCAWFAAVWGFSPLSLVPLYMLGLVLCAFAGGIFIVWRSRLALVRTSEGLVLGAGPDDVFICNECVDLFTEVFRGNKQQSGSTNEVS